MGGRGGGSGGPGGSGAVAAISGNATGKAQVRQFLKRGLQGTAIHQTGLRPESFAHLRAGGKVLGGGIKVTVYPDGKFRLQDGRHRTTIARESGVKSLTGTVTVLGPRGGVRATYDGPIKI